MISTRARDEALSECEQGDRWDGRHRPGVIFARSDGHFRTAACFSSPSLIYFGNRRFESLRETPSLPREIDRTPSDYFDISIINRWSNYQTFKRLPNTFYKSSLNGMEVDADLIELRDFKFNEDRIWYFFKRISIKFPQIIRIYMYVIIDTTRIYNVPSITALQSVWRRKILILITRD